MTKSKQVKVVITKKLVTDKVITINYTTKNVKDYKRIVKSYGDENVKILNESKEG